MTTRTPRLDQTWAFMTCASVILGLGLWIFYSTVRGGPDAPIGGWTVLVQEKTSTHLLIIECLPRKTWPGKHTLRFTLKNLKGELINSSVFFGGWDLEVTAGSVVSGREAGGALVELHSLNGMKGPDVSEQFYRVIGNSLRLVRLEDEKGHLVPNVYSRPDRAIGPSPPPRSAEEWEQALRSSDEGEVLATLVWLGGVHAKPTDPLSDDGGETREQAQLVHSVRVRQDVKEQILRLERSRNPWISAAAMLAFKYTQEPGASPLRDP